MSISNINEFIRNEVVAIMSGARGGHRQTIKVKNSSNDRKNGQKLKLDSNRHLRSVLVNEYHN